MGWAAGDDQIKAAALERERALREITRALASDLDEQHVLELAIHCAQNLVGAPCARVWLLDDSGERLLCVGSSDSLAPRLTTEGLPLDSLTGEVATGSHRIMNLPDATLHPSWQDKGFKGRTGLGAYLAAGITRAGETLGVLQVMREVSRPFEEPDELLVSGLADSLAIAVSNARLYRQARDELAERERTEAVLRESEDRYRQMFEGNQAVKLLIDPRSGEIVDANGAACAFYGYSHEQLLKLSVREINQLTPEQVQVEMQNARERQRSYFLFRHRLAGGEIRDVEVHSSPVDVGGRQLLFSIIHDITERRQAEAALQYQAWHDQLTGLFNRAFLRSELERRLSVPDSDRQPFALLLVDLDHFKDVNDTLGHSSGDRLLQQVANRFISEIGDITTLGRMGGDEFVILVPETTSERAQSVAKRLLAILERPFELESSQVEIGCSMGIALFPQHGGDADTLLRQADVAMYAAKKSGAGCAIYDPQADCERPERLQMAADLRHAIERDELLLHYQPQVDVRSGAIVAVEALVRWQHPARGLVAPDMFIPLAEETRLIQRLTRWVVAAALRQCAAWRADGWDIPVSVNVSAQDLHDPTFPEYVAGSLRQAGVAADRLHLEITESSLMADPRRVSAILDELRRRGVQIGIDDFGTGYSSLAYLQRLPVDELKIDRSFIRDIVHGKSARAIVRSVIDLGKGLGLRIVAEGVEDRATCEVLGALGCAVAQGYYFARPLLPTQLARWATEWSERQIGLAKSAPSTDAVITRPTRRDGRRAA